MKARDLMGQKFGRLTVLERAGTDKYRYVVWLCECECGKRATVRGQHLWRGDTQSCGCLRQEARVRNGKISKHGHYKNDRPSRTWVSWRSMTARCNNPRHRSYKDYGGRGITVCDAWLDFENFLADMGERPEGRSLDRIDNEGNYEPGNCRWATPSEQASNRRPPHFSDLPEWVTPEWLLAAHRYLMQAIEREEAA